MIHFESGVGFLTESYHICLRLADKIIVAAAHAIDLPSQKKKTCKFDDN
jgi:hypothetical protein